MTMRDRLHEELEDLWPVLFYMALGAILGPLSLISIPALAALVYGVIR